MTAPFFCWHRWAKWSARRTVEVVLHTPSQRIEGNAEIQDRVCEKCGKYQIRTIELDE